MIDLRTIESEYFNPFNNYSKEEIELFRKPSNLSHFTARVDCLVLRRNNNRLDGLPKGDGVFFQCLKEYVLNLIPTMNIKLTVKLKTYLYDILGPTELHVIMTKYGAWLKNFS